jgi:hypothetical protein
MRTAILISAVILSEAMAPKLQWSDTKTKMLVVVFFIFLAMDIIGLAIR